MDWNSAILWGLIGIACTIFFGFIFSYIFYRKGLKKKRLICHRTSTSLISENISKYKDLKILYDNNEIQTLTSTLINFKNVGNDIIDPNDIIPSDPIIIKTTGHFLFSVNTTDTTLSEVTVSTPKVKVNLEHVDSSNLKLNFDFLPPKCEISITLLHSGDIDITGDLKIGTFTKNVKNYDSESKHYMIFMMDKFMDKYIVLLTKLLYLITIMLFVLMPYEYLTKTNEVSPNTYTQEDIYYLCFFPIAGIFLLIHQMIREKNKNIPKSKNNKDSIDDN